MKVLYNYLKRRYFYIRGKIVSPKLYGIVKYFLTYHKYLNINNPKTFDEKLWWLKLNYYNPLMTTCAGKNKVRDYVKSRGLERILNEQYGVYSTAEEIPFEKLPDEFVLKATVGSASQQVMIVRDKSKLDLEETRKKVNSWLELYPNDGTRMHVGREWPYDGVKTEIIAEKYIDSSMCPEGLVSYTSPLFISIFCRNYFASCSFL